MPFLVSPAGNPRNLGSLIQATWNFSLAATAYVRGWDGGSFADPSGLTFSINKNGAGAVLITMGADTTPALVRTRINLAVPGVAVGSGNRIDIEAATSIVITGMSTGLFSRIGVPNMTRDRGQTAATLIQLPVSIDGPEVEHVSLPITVPAGANRVTIWAAMIGGDDAEHGGDFLVCWGNGLDGETITNVYAAPMQAGLSGTIDNASTNSPFGQQLAYVQKIHQVGSAGGPYTTFRTYELTVPPHAATLRLVALSTHSEDPLVTTPQYDPPAFSARIGFGAR